MFRQYIIYIITVMIFFNDEMLNMTWVELGYTTETCMHLPAILLP